MISFLASVAVALLLAARLYFAPVPTWAWLGIARWTIPALLVAGSAVMTAGRINVRRGASNLRVLGSTALRAWLLLLWAVLATVADLLSGQPPFVFLVAAVVSGMIGWKDRLFTLLVIPLAALLTGAAAFFLQRGLQFGTTDILAVSAGVSLVIAWTIRSNVAPGEERLQYLERENKELWDLSFRDSLTGLYNRRFAQETGQKLISRALRYHEQLHALMLDIDHFKKVNDKISHAAGDIVLREISMIIQECVRSSDFVARYGGEEFVIFLVQADPELVQNIANRIRDSIASHRFESVPWQVTISIGIASIQDNEKFDELIDRADKYLYVSKRSGRNRVSGF